MALAAEELCRASASIGTVFLASLSLACYPIYKFRSEEQKKNTSLPYQRRELACFALTESGAAVTPEHWNSAVLQGDKYVIKEQRYS